MAREKSKDERITELEQKVKALEALRFRVNGLEKRFDALGQIIINIQPVLGRLIAVGVALERKGLFNGDDLNKVETEAADNFVATANPKFAEEVRSEPHKAGTVESSVRYRSAGLSGDARPRGAGPSDPIVEDGKRSNVLRLSDVRAAHGPGDGTPDAGTVETQNVPHRGTEGANSGDGNTSGT